MLIATTRTNFSRIRILIVLIILITSCSENKTTSLSLNNSKFESSDQKIYLTNVKNFKSISGLWSRSKVRYISNYNSKNEDEKDREYPNNIDVIGVESKEKEIIDSLQNTLYFFDFNNITFKEGSIHGRVLMEGSIPPIPYSNDYIIRKKKRSEDCIICDSKSQILDTLGTKRNLLVKKNYIKVIDTKYRIIDGVSIPIDITEMRTQVIHDFKILSSKDGNKIRVFDYIKGKYHYLEKVPLDLNTIYSNKKSNEIFEKKEQIINVLSGEEIIDLTKDTIKISSNTYSLFKKMDSLNTYDDKYFSQYDVQDLRQEITQDYFYRTGKRIDGKNSLIIKYLNKLNENNLCDNCFDIYKTVVHIDILDSLVSNNPKKYKLWDISDDQGFKDYKKENNNSNYFDYLKEYLKNIIFEKIVYPDEMKFENSNFEKSVVLNFGYISDSRSQHKWSLIDIKSSNDVLIKVTDSLFNNLNINKIGKIQDLDSNNYISYYIPIKIEFRTPFIYKTFFSE